MLYMNTLKIVFLILILVCITLLHYFMMRHEHMFVVFLFYIPLVLGSLWYGLRGALAVCAAMAILYTPHLIIHIHWNNFSQKDFDEVMEIVTFVSIGVLFGTLVDRERRHVKALMEEQSLAAVGRTVSEIAHDMKTPLMAIGGFVIQVARKISEEDPNRKKLDMAVKETARLEDMVKSMLEFSRPVDLDISETDVNAVVKNVAEVLHDTAEKSGVALDLDLTAVLPPIQADQEKIHRVLLNVITNAIQASPSEKSVRVTTRVEKGNATIEITDHGQGIEEDHRESVFHPFFTTKKSGTGLGLGIAKKIVDAHGGAIFFYPNKDQPGVTFVIKLPLTPIT